MSIKQNLFNKIQDAAKFAAPSTSFWQQILTFLKEEWKVDEDHLGHYFVRQGDANDDSIIATVEVNADLNEDAWTAIYNDANFWNESINDIIGELKKFKNHNNALFNPWIYDDIRYANAAIDFGSDYVKPKNNIDGFAYAAVRGNDKFTYVLNNKANLQFTHTQPNEDGTFSPFAKWLRLIMPKNTRRVEIEDLDRNFWVIGQSLSIISKYLFDDNSPLAKILGDMLREITEQWENVLYLWADYITMTGRNQDISLILDLPVDEFHPHRKFDEFDNGIIPISQLGDSLSKKFAFLPQKYPKSRISLWVRVRAGNYKNNYYTIEGYPYYGYCSNGHWTWHGVGYPAGDDDISKQAIHSNINSFLSELKGLNNKGEYGDYSSAYPIAAIRAIPEIIQGGDIHQLRYILYDAVRCTYETRVPPLRVYESEEGSTAMVRNTTAEGDERLKTTSIAPIYPGEVLTKDYEEWM